MIKILLHDPSSFVQKKKVPNKLECKISRSANGYFSRISKNEVRIYKLASICIFRPVTRSKSLLELWGINFLPD